MKNNVLKFIVSLGFIFISLSGALFLYTIKEEAKLDNKIKNNKELTKIYEAENIDYEFNLPLILIDTNNKNILENEKINTNVLIYDNKKNNNKLSDLPKIQSHAQIKIRGNTTKYFPKKQYSITFADENNKKKDIGILGMDDDSEWVLNGPFADKSFMRNYLAYTVSDEIMGYAPDVRFCEVFVIDDGSKTIKEKHYKGIYVFIEKIGRDKDKVNITKTQDNTNETSFIIAKDRNKSEDIKLDSYGKETYIYDYGINIEYPKEELTSDKYKYISQHVSEFERILYSDKFNDPLIGYEKYIDVDSFIDFYIINEFFINTDAGILSTYFHKDYNDKIKAGPVWDFNRSMGNYDIREKKIFDYKGFSMIDRSWFDRLMEDIKFSSKVISRYKELRKTYLSDDYLISLINKTANYLGEAVDRDENVWPVDIKNQADTMKMESIFMEYKYVESPSEYNKFLINNKDLFRETDGMSKSFEEEIKLMKEFITKRGKWMDENIDTLSKWSS